MYYLLKNVIDVLFSKDCYKCTNVIDVLFSKECYRCII